MTTDSLAATVLIAVVQLALALGCAPLLQGITKQLKARLQYRRGPSIWQPYRDLRKWWGKTPVESDTASVLTAIAPVIVLTAMVLAVLLVPIVALRSPLEGTDDLLVVLGLLALARFVLALAALDAGSAFGGMGASREVAIASLVEPGVLLSLAVAVATAGTTDLAEIATCRPAAGHRGHDPEPRGGGHPDLRGHARTSSCGRRRGVRDQRWCLRGKLCQPRWNLGRAARRRLRAWLPAPSRSVDPGPAGGAWSNGATRRPGRAAGISGRRPPARPRPAGAALRCR